MRISIINLLVPTSLGSTASEHCTVKHCTACEHLLYLFLWLISTSLYACCGRSGPALDENCGLGKSWKGFRIKTRRTTYCLICSAAKSLQSCPTLCDPIDGSPPGSPAPGTLQAKTLEWVAISFPKAWKWKMKVKSLSHVRLLVTPWTAAYQAPPSRRFSRQEYWSGVPLPSPILYAQAWTISRSLCWAIPGAFPKPLDSNEIQPCTQKLMILFMTIKIDFILVLKKILVFLYMLTPSGSF